MNIPTGRLVVAPTTDVQYHKQEHSTEPVGKPGPKIGILMSDQTATETPARVQTPAPSARRMAALDVPRAVNPSPVPSGASLDDPALYFNKELSWVDFNWRVLALAMDERTPLLERVKFTAITASNLDEFVQKRIGGLRRQEAAGVRQLSDDGRTPEEQLRLLHAAAMQMHGRQLTVDEHALHVECRFWSREHRLERLDRRRASVRDVRVVLHVVGHDVLHECGANVLLPVHQVDEIGDDHAVGLREMHGRGRRPFAGGATDHDPGHAGDESCPRTA